MSTLAVRRPSDLRSWRGLAVLSGVACVLILLWYGVGHRDLEALALAGVILLGIGLALSRLATAGVLLLAVVFADTIVFLLPAANANANARAGVNAMFVPGSVTGLALAGLVGAVMAIRSRRQPDAGRRSAMAAGAVALAFVGGGLSMTWLLTPSPPPTAPAGAVRLESRSLAFAPDRLSAGQGEVTVAMRNQDLFWHTFTISELGVNMPVPVGGLRSVTFRATPGTYRFVCAIPTHEQAGMRGTLVVR